MLNKLLKRFGKNGKSNLPIRYAADDHSISNDHISHAALSVTEGLQRAGYEAYIVGGGVRDSLLNGKPKDFDVATNATPEEVVSVFKRARLIGRRFKIVHVRFGREIIEVTTFRASHNEANSKQEATQSDKGILLRDNVYGDIQSDAMRRDFTINALYYDPSSREILDFTNGFEDIKAKQINIIGDPDARYKEDPVRMLRALRFACRLGFTISPDTNKPIREHSEYLDHIPPARLFEEVLKLFMSGYAEPILHALKDYHLLAYLLPAADACLDHGSEIDKKLLFVAAANTDARIHSGKRVTPAFIYAAMMWPALTAEIKDLVANKKLTTFDAMQQASQGVISQQLSFTSIPKRFLIPIREIWNLQLRLDKRTGNKAERLMEHNRFRAAYDFVLLREQAGENMNGLGEWWTIYQRANADDKLKMVKNLGKDPSSNNKSRRRRRKSPPPANPAE